jgi:tol-pal system beta propeller repeat protein TolB
MHVARLAAALVLAAGAACALEPDPVLPPLPPGRDIAYVSQGIGFRSDIFVLSGDAASDSNITLYTAYDFWPSWSPDGSQIAFESNRDDSLKTEVYVVTLVTSAVMQLTFDTGFVDGQPAWSPLGDRIAFASDRDSAGTDIYLMDVNGQNIVRLTTDPGNDAQPTWSPTGDRIAFVSDRRGGGGTDVYVMDTLGNNVVNVTNNAAVDLAPAWSPDGLKIAFHSNSDPAGFAVWVIDTTGANPLKISPTNPPCELPSWTPDGLRIAYDCDGDIYIASPDGTNRQRITRTTNVQRLESMPRWKPVP